MCAPLKFISRLGPLRSRGYFYPVCGILNCQVLYFPFIRPVYRDKWVRVTTAWRVLRLLMGEWPPDIEGSSEYTE